MRSLHPPTFGNVIEQVTLSFRNATPGMRGKAGRGELLYHYLDLKRLASRLS